MKNFFKYLVMWVSQNLSIPFWVLGHFHLMTNIYDDIYEFISSFGMNILVATGFWISYKEYRENNK